MVPSLPRRHHLLKCARTTAYGWGSERGALLSYFSRRWSSKTKSRGFRVRYGLEYGKLFGALVDYQKLK